ncbi:MAG: DnaA regulatory inactivator Hda [Gammaproteobacteria bacterium]|nr:DnaA regulatory inactivator Hda [Gammaproteobacteria bacterium]
MSGESTQLTLPFPLNERCVFANFVTGPNTELVDRLQQIASVGQFSSTWLWGGAGKSHLLQGTCQNHAEHGRAVAYLPLADTDGHIESLRGFGGYSLVAVDDLDVWLGDERLESELLTLYEDLYSSGNNLLMASTSAPAEITFALPDLASRFRSANCYCVQGLADDDKAEVLRLHAEVRGLLLAEPVLNFWLNRGARSLKELLAQLDVVDGAAMVRQRRVTVPLLKQVLGL